MTLMYERNDCPVCFSTDSHTIYQCPYRFSPVLDYMSSTYEGVIPTGLLDKEVYELVLCRSCGLLYQKRVLNEIMVSALYSDFFCQEPNGEEIIPTRSLALDFARHVWCMGGVLGTPPNETLLVDFGSGWGRWLRVAQGFGYQVAGVEIARPRREYVQKMGILCEETIEALPSPDGVNCEQVLEHVLHPIEILSQITRHLRPGG